MFITSGPGHVHFLLFVVVVVVVVVDVVVQLLMCVLP